MRLSGKSLLEDMTDIVIGKKNEVFLKLKAEPHVFQELSEHFTFDVPGAKFMPSIGVSIGMERFDYSPHILERSTLDF